MKVSEAHKLPKAQRRELRLHAAANARFHHIQCALCRHSIKRHGANQAMIDHLNHHMTMHTKYRTLADALHVKVHRLPKSEK